MTVLSDNIAVRRRDLGLTATAFARRIGINPPSYYKYESGQLAPAPRTLAHIAQALGCTPSDLLTGGETEYTAYSRGERSTLLNPYAPRPAPPRRYTCGDQHTIGAILAGKRAFRNLTFADMARALRMRPNVYARIEYGYRPFDDDLLDRLAHVLNKVHPCRARDLLPPELIK